MRTSYRALVVALLALVPVSSLVLLPQASQAADPLPSPTMSISTAGAVHPYGSRFTLTVRLLGPTVNTAVRVYATPAGQPERLIAAADVDRSTHQLKVSFLPRRNSAFRASFDGDAFWGPASARARVAVSARLSLTSPSRAMTGRFHRLPSGSAAVTARVAAAPAPPLGCVRIARHRLVGSTWKLLGTSPCLRRDAANQVRVRLPRLAPGTKLRVTARYGASTVNAPSPVRRYYVVLV